MHYITRDGLEIVGETAEDVIDGLRADSRCPGVDRAEFLALLADGARRQTGAVVRASDAESALADLVSAGLMRKLADEPN